MNYLDGWAQDNLPSFTESAVGIFTGVVLVGQFLGMGAGLVLGPFFGWGLAILLHQWLVARPRREEDDRRSEEHRTYWAEERRLRAKELEEMAWLRNHDRAEYKRRCQAKVDERRRYLAERKAELNAILERGEARGRRR